ncbi:MAG: hypothetical protein ACREQV_25835, partial [Candidatus Binatia bacterium]
MLLRLPFIFLYPITIDESAYLYDAKALFDGIRTAGDVWVKTPVSIIVYSLGVWGTGGSLFASRLVALGITLASLIPLWKFTVTVADRFTAHVAVLLWAIAAGPVHLLSFGHTQAVSSGLLISCLGIAAVYLARPRKGQASLWWGIALGLVFAAAYLSRKTSAAIAIPLLVMMAWHQVPHKRVLAYGGGFAVSLVVVLLSMTIFASSWYGPSGARELSGGGYLSLIGQNTFSDQELEEWGGGGKRVGQVFAATLQSLAVPAFYSLLFLSFHVFGTKKRWWLIGA